MRIPEAFAALESSPTFVRWRDGHESYYLVHAFAMFEQEPSWQFGYYSPDDDRIVSWKTGPVESLPAEEVFKKDGVVEELDLDAVAVDESRALAAAEEARAERCPAERVQRSIVILQRLERQLYNITLVTDAFNMLTVRVAADTGETLSVELRSVLSLRQD